MTETGAVPGFLPSTHGLGFTNDFPPEPDVRVDLGPLGTVGIGDASQGLCGGMVFAVRDYVEAGVLPPSATGVPDPGSAMFPYLVTRLVDSFDLPSGVARYLQWMLLPAADAGLGGFTVRGTDHRTLGESWPVIRADIDGGHLSPLALVTVHTADISRIGRCHQVLAYGYAVDPGQLTLAVYDPNTGPAGADDVTIRVTWDAGAGVDTAGPLTITHNLGIPETGLHGFFRSAYTPRTPPGAAAGTPQASPQAAASPGQVA